MPPEQDAAVLQALNTPSDLYDPRLHDCAQTEASRRFWILHDVLDDAPQLLDQEDMQEALAAAVQACQIVEYRTPNAVLSRLKSNLQRRTGGCVFVVLDLLLLVTGMWRTFHYALLADWEMAWRWGVVAVLAVVCNRVAVRLSGREVSELERVHLRILSCWERGRTCSECGHEPHVPNGCDGCRCGTVEADL